VHGGCDHRRRVLTARESQHRQGSETFFANADLHQFFGNTDPLTLEQISARLGVTDMKEIPLPPAAPTGGNLGIGQMIGGGGARDKRDYMGQQRGILGGAISMLEQGGAAAAQAKYQDDMNSYQREIAQHGNARLSPDEVSALIHKKDTGGANLGDVGVPLIRPEQVRGLKKWSQIIVKDGMSQPIQAKLIPYFERKDWYNKTDKNPYR